MTQFPHRVARGDSTGVGIGASANESYVARVFAKSRVRWPDARLTNLCESGATSATVKARQLARAVSAAPDLVTLFVGGNDVWRQVEPIEFGRNLDTIAHVLRGLGIPVVMGTVANLAHAPAAELAERFAGIPKSRIERRVKSFNVEVARVAAMNGFAVLDLFGVGLADRAHYFSIDGFHPSAAGYAAWAEMLWPMVERLVATRVA